MRYDEFVDLPARIRFARQAALLSQDKLGDRLGGVSGAAVSWWESGRNEPGLDRLLEIAEVTGVSYSWLATGSGPIKEEESGDGPVFTKQALSVAEKFDRLTSHQQAAFQSLLASMLEPGAKPPDQPPPKPAKKKKD
jgi:transcriptional regulator with XRE-family HTH domain